jgi:hypothetical protein
MKDYETALSLVTKNYETALSLANKKYESTVSQAKKKKKEFDARKLAREKIAQDLIFDTWLAIRLSSTDDVFGRFVRAISSCVKQTIQECFVGEGVTYTEVMRKEKSEQELEKKQQEREEKDKERKEKDEQAVREASEKKTEAF